MSDYLVIPRRPDGSLAWPTAQVVAATDAPEAATVAYMRCIVVPCDVFDGEPGKDAP